MGHTRIEGIDWRILNSTFVWLGSDDAPHFAISEANLGADPTIIRSNAFIGWGGADGALYLDETDTPISDPRRLDLLAGLPICGRGGNLAFANAAEAGLLSTNPGSVDYLRLAPGSPLVDAGIDLDAPLTCEEATVYPHVQDVDGLRRPCGNGYDIGPREWCGD